MNAPAIPDAADREIELALQVDPALWDRLGTMAFLSPVLAAPVRPAVTAYYDTPDFAFKKAGFALRVRERGGVFTQTIKSEINPQAGLKDRRELNWTIASLTPDAGPIDDPVLRQKVEAALAGPSVRELFRTVIDRRQAVVPSPCGSVIEISADRGWIEAPSGRLPINEVELELISGRARALLDLGARLAASAPFRLGVRSKAERGYALITQAKPLPVKSGRIALTQSETAEDAFAHCLKTCLTHGLANEAVIMESREPGGIHQMRVSLRRLRALLAVYRRALGRDVLASLNARAKALADRLGHVRDLDVLRADILDPALSKLAGHDGVETLLERVEAARKRAWEDLLTDFQRTGRVASFALDLDRDIERRFWRSGAANTVREDLLALPVRDFAALVLKRRAKRVRSKAFGLETLSIPDRHVLRLEIKKLRYAVDFYANLFDAEKVQTYAKQLARLQDMFGALNDFANAETVLPALAVEEAAPDPQIADAVTRVIAWHEKQAAAQWKKTKARYLKWDAAAPFWE